MTTYETRLDIKSWDENPYRELPDGTKFARAEVTLAAEAAGADTALTEGSFEALLYYKADGTSTYVTLMSLTGTVEGRSGRLVLAGDGGYDGKTARMRANVVEATGDLAGLTGTVVSESTHEDYPHMPLTLTYELG
jgi:Protein of unknown function (DUF3224)